PLARYEKGQLHYAVTDTVGRVQELVTEDGTIVWRGKQQLWGREESRNKEDAPSCRLRFPGQYEDAESGLYYNRFRYYDGETGQYISADPIGLAGGINTYAYVKNPLSYIDPLGLTGCDVAKTRDLAATISDKFKQLFKCDKFAEALKNKMQKAGINGEHLIIDTINKNGAFGNIWSDRVGKNIATNGHHEAIKVGDTIFDNMNPSGIKYDDWLNDLYSPSAYDITTIGF
ncbi:RHS repeat-associated core domain-containing protein, partial [Citrobacter freundii]|uniref:RHS repeat-associated core domain-containing protein n=1 Tax=Citrobacter freundii TaxID=546 RepID=UPI0025A7CC57|nr:RHS domain-containing protein [Citrobacter freundii]